MKPSRLVASLIVGSISRTISFAPSPIHSAGTVSRLGRATQPTPRTQIIIRNMAAKAGVASPEELKDFVAAAGEKLLVVDVRHPDASVEPGDAKSLSMGFKLPNKEENYRPKAVSLPWSRETNSMELPAADKDTFIITHCGGGGRGQKQKPRAATFHRQGGM